MTRLWGWILHGCWHRWAYRRTVSKTLTYSDGREIETDLRVVCECTRCGRWKAWRL